MQSNGWFVEHVEHTHEPASDLGGEADALRFSTRERARVAVEREVVEPDVEKKLQSLIDFFQDTFCNHAVAFRQRQRAQHRCTFVDWHIADFVDVVTVDCDRQRNRFEPRTTAFWAWHLAHVALNLFAAAIRIGFSVAALQPRNHAFVLCLVLALTTVSVLVTDRDLGFAGAVQHELLVICFQLFPRRRGLELVFFGDRGEDTSEKLTSVARPGRYRTFIDGEILIRNDKFGVDLKLCTKAVASFAGTVRRVERKIARC